MVAILYLLPLLVAAAHSEDIHVHADLQKVVKLERELLHNFSEYVKRIEERVRIMNGAIAEYSRLLKYVDKQPDLYMSNPIFAFRLLNHMCYDWRSWQLQMLEPLGAEQIELQHRFLSLIPKAQAHKQAAENLLTLFRFYDYAPATFLMHSKQHLRLKPWDYYHMGRELYRQRKYHEAMQWLDVARVNYTSSAHGMLLGVKAERIFEIQSQVLAEQRKETNATLTWDQELELLTVGRSPSAPNELPTELQRQCRGNFTRDLQLVCELITDFSPFLQLAPLQMEEVSYDPIVMLYRNGANERVITHLTKAFEHCPPNALLTRIPGMKICSISDIFSMTSIALMERLTDMSGFQLHSKQFFMLEYSPRDPFSLLNLYKFLKVQEKDIDATAIVFLNDMDLGGTITIANYDLAVSPSRGDALIFVHEDDFRITLCPNMVGNRLVLIKFLASVE